MQTARTRQLYNKAPILHALRDETNATVNCTYLWTNSLVGWLERWVELSTAPTTAPTRRADGWSRREEL